MIENLSQEQLAGILETIPIEISFVNEDDVVKFWNKHETRIFQPQKSDKVNEILSDLKAGKRDSAEFWINLREKKVYIRYFAVRNKAGKYLGTLEVTQDITEIKEIEGEKRLLDY